MGVRFPPGAFFGHFRPIWTASPRPSCASAHFGAVLLAKSTGNARKILLFRLVLDCVVTPLMCLGKLQGCAPCQIDRKCPKNSAVSACFGLRRHAPHVPRHTSGLCSLPNRPEMPEKFCCFGLFW